MRNNLGITQIHIESAIELQSAFGNSSKENVASQLTSDERNKIINALHNSKTILIIFDEISDDNGDNIRGSVFDFPSNDNASGYHCIQGNIYNESTGDFTSIGILLHDDYPDEIYMLY